MGLFDSKEMWSTAYYCANDEQEFISGQGVLRSMLWAETNKLREENDHRVGIFYSRGADVYGYAESFERLLTSMAFSSLCAYITCFCKPNEQEDFYFGLLSQWRGYGVDGGYALQFNREKLEKIVVRMQGEMSLGYDLQDVYYSVENPFKQEVLDHSEAFLAAYSSHLDELAKPLDFDRKTWTNPIPNLLNGPLESLITYLTYTKNKHFAEEKECRLSLVQPIDKFSKSLEVRYLNRGGLIVPYTATPKEKFDILSCIDGIIVGPGHRMGARYKSVCQLVKQSGYQIMVRPSEIPFTRA